MPICFEVQNAAQRSAELTRQLLAFARKQTVSPRVINLSESVQDLVKMLSRLIGEDITLHLEPGDSVWPVKIDPTQLDQILANLCVNARDAIIGNGRIIIEMQNVVFDDEYCHRHTGFLPGHFVMLAVSDDGVGMDKELLDKIFEPFFTTKSVGEGTGLGLATVYGIVKQNDGFINVYSEPGQGATFKIYLPRFAGDAEVVARTERLEIPRSRGETIVLVEDERPILKLTTRILTALGYTVLDFDSAGEILSGTEGFNGDVQLLITDVVMPETNGRELADKLQITRPNLKVLFMSGYTSDVIVHRGVLQKVVNFIQKPFTVRDLAVKVRQSAECVGPAGGPGLQPRVS